MKKIQKKFIWSRGFVVALGTLIFIFGKIAFAVTILNPGGGGTGWGFPGGIQANTFILGNGLNPFATTTIPLSPAFGGLGTSTVPTFGKIPVGNAGGTYTLTSTSTLGIPITLPASPIGALQIDSSTNTFRSLDGAVLDLTGNTRGTCALDLQSARSALTQVASGRCSVALGLCNTASAYQSIAIGQSNTASQYQSIAIGLSNSVPGQNASTIGVCNTASNEQTSALGFQNTASGYYSSAIGHGNTASGYCSVAFGLNTSAPATRSSAFGITSTAFGDQSNAFGGNNTACSGCSSAIGYFNTASGCLSSAFGAGNTASGCLSSAFGSNLTNAIANSAMLGTSITAANNLIVLSTGNVGVGTTNPTDRLYVSTATANTGITLINTAGSNAGALINFEAASNGFGASQGGQLATAGDLFSDIAAGDFAFRSAAGKAFRLGSVTNAASTLVILSNKNVGINTANPTKDLVLTQQTTTGGFQFTGCSIGGTSSGTGVLNALGYNVTGNKQFWIGDPDYAGCTTGNFVRYTSISGVVGIDAVRGDNLQRARLQIGVGGDSNSGVTLGGDFLATNPASYVWANGNVTIGSGYKANAAPTDGLLVQGNVGVGTATVDSQFQVAGSFGAMRIGYNSTNVNYFDGDTQNFRNTSGGTTQMTITGNKVGIGTTSPFATLSVVGNESLTGGLYDSLSSLGANGYILQSTGSATKWISSTSTPTTGIASSADLTGITGATTITTYAVPAGSNHQFRIGAYINVTAVTLDVAQVQVTYTDENNAAVTANFFPQGLTSANIASTGDFSLPPQDIRVKAGTTITLKTILTTGTGSITYDVGGTIQLLN